MTDPLLYRCPSHSAWISVRQCGHNAKLGETARKAEPGSETALAGLSYKESCQSCMGVVRLAKEGGIKPRKASSLRSGQALGPAVTNPRSRRRSNRYKQPRPAASNSRQRGQEVTMAGGIFGTKTLSAAGVERALQALGISLGDFNDEYRKICQRRSHFAAPTSQEVAAVEAFQKTGDLATLRRKLDCSPNRAYSTVARVTAHQARTRKGPA